jgi:hypothetical protein
MPATVTVASKLPFPLLLEMPVGSGAETRRVPIRGNAVRPGQSRPYLAGGEEKAIKFSGDEQTYIVGAAALTPNVDADFWNAWLKAYGDAPYVKNGFVFAHGSHDGAAKMAGERASMRTGLEGLDADKPAPHLTKDI